MDERRGSKGMQFDADDLKRRIAEAKERANGLRKEASELDAHVSALEGEIRASVPDMGRIDEAAKKLDHALKGSLGGQTASSTKGSLG